MILAIDPGTDESGWVYYDTRGGVGLVRGHDKSANEDILRRLKFTPQWRDAQIVIEQLEAFGPRRIGNEYLWAVAWANRFYQQAAIHCVNPPVFIRRRVVRRHITGDSQCGDREIRDSLIERFGPGKAKAIGRKKTPGPLYGLRGDELAALALAITFAERKHE